MAPTPPIAWRGFTSLSRVSDAGSSEDPSPTPEGIAPGPPPARGSYLRDIAASFRNPTPRASSATRSEIVNGLERREAVVGIILTSLAVFLAVVGYHVLIHSTNKTLRPQATVFLIATLIGAGILVLGTVFRRRALLGFGAFLVGLEFFTYRLTIEGLFYLAVGGWLIFRVMQNRKSAAGAARTATPRAAGAAKQQRPTTVAPPKASKRYTPPKRAAAGRRR